MNSSVEGPEGIDIMVAAGSVDTPLRDVDGAEVVIAIWLSFG